ncbi:unnamed protein product [Brassica oleracea]
MVCGPHHRFGQTDENTRKHVLKLAKERDTCQPLTTREDTRLATTPDHAGIRATTRNSTRTLTRGTESISNDKFNRNRKRNRDRDLIQGKAHAHHKLVTHLDHTRGEQTEPRQGRLHAVEKTTVYQRKPAAIAGEEGKDAGDKSRTTIESNDATPETEPADHRRKGASPETKTDLETLLSLLLVKD